MQLIRRYPGSVWVIAIATVFVISLSNSLLLNLSTLAVSVILVWRASASNKSGVPVRLILSLTVGIILIRVLFRVLFSADDGTAALLQLPSIQLNFGLGNLELLGPISVGALTKALFDGSRLAAIMAVVTAANLLADSRKLLRRAPGALFEVATSVVLALNFIPQLTESISRINRSSRLRGHSRGLGFAAVVVPVFEDAFDRSIHLAASMDVRGFGWQRALSPTRLRAARALAVVAMLAILLGVSQVLFGELVVASAMIALGLGLGAGSLAVRRRRSN